MKNVTYKCPDCGELLNIDIDNDNVYCEYCGLFSISHLHMVYGFFFFRYNEWSPIILSDIIIPPSSFYFKVLLGGAYYLFYSF